MAILGLMHTKQFEQFRDTDFRRRIFYDFPEGGFPLVGLLSLMETQETVDPIFSHWEKRLLPIRTKTASQGSNKGPFKTSSGSDAGDPVNFTAGTKYMVCVADASRFRPGAVLMITVALNSGGEGKVYGNVSAVDTNSTPNTLTFDCIESVSGVANGVTNESVGLEVLQIGTAYHEGRKDIVAESYEFPTRITNYTQIHRTPFQMTRTALKNPVQYDKTGTYRDYAKGAAVNHMIDLEHSFIFGRKKEEAPASVTPDPSTGAGLPRRYTGGIIYHLERWEAGDYAPDLDVANDNSVDKRIIELSSGQLSEQFYDQLLARLFSRGSQRTPERLCICGWGFASVINTLFKRSTQLQAQIPAEETYGMKVTAHLTPFGTIYYKTHPLFNVNPVTRYWGLFVDVGSLRYRPMSDSDTRLLKMRQPNDADYRMDEWLTEAGLEVFFPERFMLIKNVRSALM
jgi:hypothetical protein